MEVLYIVLLSILVLCLVLALCICCFANSRFCHCIDIIDVEDLEPKKGTTTTSTKELSQSEYYSNSTPVLRSSASSPKSDFATNGAQYTPLLSQYQSKPLLDAEANKTTFYTSPGSHSSVSETSYTTTKNAYPSEPVRGEGAYSTKTVTYTSERTPPYQVTTKTSNVARQSPSSYSDSERTPSYQVTTRTSNVSRQSPSSYSEDTFYQSRAPQTVLKRSSSQTSLYENN